MLNDNSAQQRDETLHTTTSTNDNFNDEPKPNISEALRRRAESLLNDRTIDADTRIVIRAGLEIGDSWLSELVRRADAGEPIVDPSVLHIEEANEEISIEEKIEILVELICRAGDEPAARSAALLVLMATLENSTHPKVLANHAKHLAFTHCGELNAFGIVDAQIEMLESELLTAHILAV